MIYLKAVLKTAFFITFALMNKRFFIHLAYHGAAYVGWQRQPNGVSVQQKIEEKLSLLFRQNITITGCGRTDTGVHASQYFAHFDSNFTVQPDWDECTIKLNAMLPPDIVIFSIFEVDIQLHARFSAVNRTYEYFMLNRKDPFRRDSAWLLPFKTDIKKMADACQIIKSRTDFTSFAKLHASSTNNLCKISECSISENYGLITFRISADRFVRNMVRALTGTLVDIGRKKITPEQINDIFDAASRNAASMSAPAHGLFLSGIVYPGLQNK